MKALCLAVVVAVISTTACGKKSDSPRVASAPSTAPARPSAPPESAHNQPAATTSTTPTLVPGAATTVRLGGTASTTPTTSGPASTSPPAAASTGAPDVFAPPPGRYLFDAVGQTTSGSGPTTQSRPAETAQEDDVAVTQEADALRLVVSTHSGEETQELEFQLSSGAVVLQRLTYQSSTSQTVRPAPPIPITRLPYRAGSLQEFAWRDDAAAVQGVGTSSVERFETITTAAGAFDCAVLRVQQRVRGAATGTIDLTIWIDRDSGVQAKRRLLTTFEGPASTTTSDVTATVRALP